MKLKFLFFIFALSIFTAGCLHSQADTGSNTKITKFSTAKQYSEGLTKVGQEKGCLQLKQKVFCNQLIFFYSTRGDEKNLRNLVKEMCKLGIEKKCSADEQNKFVSNALDGKVQKECDNGNIRSCIIIFNRAYEKNDDLEIAEIYAKKICKAGDKNACKFDVSKELEVRNRMIEKRELAIQQALNECAKGNDNVCNNVMYEAAETNDEKLAKKVASAYCKSGKAPQGACNGSNAKDDYVKVAMKVTKSNLKKSEEINKALKECEKGDTKHCDALSAFATKNNDEILMKEIFSAACKSGKMPRACKGNPKEFLANSIAMTNELLTQAKQECNSKNTVEACVPVIFVLLQSADINFSNLPEIKKYAEKLCKIGGDNKDFCKDNAIKYCKEGKGNEGFCVIAEAYEL